MLCVLCHAEFKQHMYVVLCHVMLSAHVALGVLSLTPMSQWQWYIVLWYVVLCYDM